MNAPFPFFFSEGSLSRQSGWLRWLLGSPKCWYSYQQREPRDTRRPPARVPTHRDDTRSTRSLLGSQYQQYTTTVTEGL